MANSVAPSDLISIIIPHYQDLDRLDRCLTALQVQNGGLNHEIIVADNNSPCGRAAVEACIAGRAQLIVETEKGAGPARNAGVRASRGDWLAFTDCDCLPDANWLANGIRALGKHDYVGGRVVVSLANPAAATATEAFESVFAFDNRRYVEQKQFTVTANLFCARAQFDLVGPFHTEVSEDLEWCHRSNAAGYHIGYAEDAIVSHPARENWQQLVKKWKRLNAETFSLFQDRPAGRARWLARNLPLPLSIIAHAPVIIRSKRISGMRDRVGALSVLVAIRSWRLADSVGLLFKSRT